MDQRAAIFNDTIEFIKEYMRLYPDDKVNKCGVVYIHLRNHVYEDEINDVDIHIRSKEIGIVVMERIIRLDKTRFTVTRDPMFPPSIFTLNDKK